MSDDKVMPQVTSPLTAALAAAQAELADPRREKLMRVPGRPDRKYAGLDDLLQTVRPVLAKHGIAIVQTIEPLGDQLVLCTQLRHASGEVFTSHWPLKWGGGPQDQGSQLSYGRRYTLEAICGVAATEDDDAEQASAPEPTKTRNRRPAPDVQPEVERPESAQATAKGWTAVQQRRFFAQLKSFADPAVDYESELAPYCEREGAPGGPERPSDMAEGRRQKLLVWLSDAAHRREVVAWAGANVTRVEPEGA